MGRNVSLSTSRLTASRQQPTTEFVSRSKYNKLQNHLANVTEWLAQERQKVEKLSGMRDRPVWKGVNFVLADVITASDRTQNWLIINRGKNDGLAKGQFVLGSYSIIGTISDVDSRMARVKLVTDPTSKIEIRMAESNIKRIMQGAGNNSAKIWLLSKEHRVKTGDRVFARKTPGLLDGALIIGKVTGCKTDEENPLLWDITVEPSCNAEALENVAVIIMNPQR